MSINPLNDISRVYLGQVASVDESAIGNRARSAVADDRLSAEQERTNASMDKLRAQDSRHKKSTSLARAQARIAAKKSEDTARAMHPKPGVSGYRIEETGIDEAKKEKPKRWWDDDGDGIGYEKGEVSGKFKRKKVKEGFSNWRQDLAEVMNDEVDEKPIKEKKVNNKIKINPEFKESVEENGVTLLEMVEIDEVDFVIESVYGELLDEGYEDDDIEEALEYALIEAKVTYGHDTDKPYQKKTGAGQLVRAVGRLARQKLASKVSGAKTAAKAAVARGARKVAKGALGVARKMEGGDSKPSTAHTKTRSASTYRGAGAGTKEKVSSGSYTPPSKKKAEKPSDPWEGSYTKSSDTPKPKAKTKKATAPKAKAPAKKKKSSKLDDLLASVRNEEVQIDEKTLTKMEMKKREEIVKSMKDKASDFEKRYPGRGKEVMYATATKMAKKMVEQMMPEPTATTDSSIDKKKEMMDQKKLANMKMLQQKQQMLQKQKLQMQKSGRLPLEAD